MCSSCRALVEQMNSVYAPVEICTRLYSSVIIAPASAYRSLFYDEPKSQCAQVNG